MATITLTAAEVDHRSDAIFVAVSCLIICVWSASGETIAPNLSSYPVLGVTLSYLYWHRSRVDWLAVLGGTVALYALYLLRHPWAPFALIPLSGGASGACLLARWAFSRGEGRSRAERIALLPVLVVALSTVATAPQVLTYFFRQTFDGALLRADRLCFGSDPTYAIGRFVLSVPHLHAILAQWYLALGFGLIAVMVPDALDSARLKSYVRSMTAMGLCGFLIYCIVPAVGPIHAFAGYPLTPAGTAVADVTARNGFPSLHMAWAILMLLHARRGWPLTLAVAFVVMTAAATLGLGEHYVVDLLAAVPFAVLIDRLAR